MYEFLLVIGLGLFFMGFKFFVFYVYSVSVKSYWGSQGMFLG